MSTVTPFIGDVETGKYSLFDIALGGAEVVPAAKIAKTAAKTAGKSISKPINKLLKPSVMGPDLHPKQFAKKVKKATKKGIQKDMAEGLEWQKEWINDPETFLRQSGLRVNDPETFMFGRFAGGRDKEFIRLARKPNMTRAKMKKAGFIEEWDSYISYKEKNTKRFENIELVDELPFDYENVGGEAIYTRKPNLSHTMTTKEKVMRDIVIPSRKVKMGLTPERKGFLGSYRHKQILNTLDDRLKYGDDYLGTYDEMVAISPDAYHFSLAGPKSTSVHELQHYTTRGQDAIPSQVNSYINSLKPKIDKRRKISRVLKDNTRADDAINEFDAIVEKWKTNNTEIHGKRASEYSDSDLLENARYWGDNTEIQARLQQVRLALNLKPGQKVTKEMLEKIKTAKQGASPLHELDLVIGKKNITKALNALPALVPMMVEEELFNQWDREDNIF